MSDKPENEAEVVDLDIDEADLDSSEPTGGGSGANHGDGSDRGTRA